MSSERVEIRVPTSTIVKLLGTALIVFCLYRLWSELMFFLLALLLAVTLAPVVSWFERKGLPRWVGVLAITLGLCASIAAFVTLILPPVTKEVGSFVGNLPGLTDRVKQIIPESNTSLRKLADQAMNATKTPGFAAHLEPLAWGRAAFGGIATAGFVLITMLYLIVDGKRVYAWLLAYVPRAHRGRMAETSEEVSKVVYAYVRGQAITSVLFAIFVAALLAVLKLPAIAALAVFAAICDVIPVAGIVLATLPAALLALTHSPAKAITVVLAYGIYHFIEAYFIVPRVYGKELRLSTLAVILALVVGGTLQGILGAILVLPIVAAYPIVERIWLKDYLRPEVIRDHDALEVAAEEGRQTPIDAVIDGKAHPGESRFPLGPADRRGGRHEGRH